MSLPDQDRTYSKWVPDVLGCINAENVYRVTKLAAPDFVVKVTAPYPRRRGERNRTVLLTWGKPNYAERQMIKHLVAAGATFPIEELFIQDWPEKRHAKR